MLVDRERCADKKIGQSGQGCETGNAKQSTASPKTMPWITRVPRAWSSWEVTLWSKILSMHRVGEACAKHQEK